MHTFLTRGSRNPDKDMQTEASLGKVRLAAFLAVMLLPAGCGRAPLANSATEVEAAPPAGPGKDIPTPVPGVTLKPEEVQALGVETSPAQALQQAPQISGFGVVVASEPLAQGWAELRTAVAAQRQSHAALVRIQGLFGTPGALPAQTHEDAQRQAAIDEAALQLARQRLLAGFGRDAPWKDAGRTRELDALVGGRARLVRVTFPLGAFGATDPHELHLARLDAGNGGPRWTSRTLWRAPADSTVPGRSYFVYLESPEVGEGDHLLVWASTGQAQTGVRVPASAVVISGGRFYCYVWKSPGPIPDPKSPAPFVRIEINPDRPAEGGYFVDQGIAVGDRIVTAAAGQLLAREINPSREAE